MFKITACARYFFFFFYFSPNNSTSKAMKNVFLFHLKSSFLSRDITNFYIFVFTSFFSLSAIALEVDPRKILKFMT